MNLTFPQQARIVNLADSHITLLSNATTLLRAFESTIAGDTAESDFACSVRPADEAIAACVELNARLKTEWTAFTRALTEAYGNFARDVVHRQGVDEKNHVRSFALNCAGSAFSQLRTRAREFLISQIEA